MSIAGYEKPHQVRAQLAAFEHERAHIRDARHLAAIEAQEKLFRAELERMEAEGVPDEEEREAPETTWGQLAWMGGPRGQAWTPR